MTEAEWLTCGDPALLLTHAGRNVGDRKVALFRCAINRRLTKYPDGIDADAVFWVAEARADGGAPVVVVEETANLVARTQAALLPWAVPGRWVQLYGACWSLINLLRPDEPADARLDAVRELLNLAALANLNGERVRMESVATACLRCIFGNPFRPIAISPSWPTGTTVALARQMHESRDFSALPVLADALQDTGCDSTDVLDHCRDPGPHARGCWVVDLVLGKE